MQTNIFADSFNQRIEDLKLNLRDLKTSYMGYPANPIFDYSALYDFFGYHLNNAGDPFVDSPYKLDTRVFEREVIKFFAELYNLSANESWGYVTTGGTEGNIHGLFVARECFPKGILYFSEDTHYSVPKIARMLKIPHKIIKSDEMGEIDYGDLEKQIKNNKNKPVILCLNIGTTMKGAIDDIDEVLTILRRNKITKYYIHCDAALFGMILPFIQDAPQINFQKPIDSIAISGHKFIGSPIPCGITLSRAKNVQKISRDIEYIGVPDTTITGSRNAITPLMLWYAIQSRGIDGFKTEAENCLANAKYLQTSLQSIDYFAQLNKYSNIVFFRKPSTEIAAKWQLAIHGEWAHIVVMQHVTKDKIDLFINDLKSEKKVL